MIMNQTDFFNKVYEIVAKIPEGKVMTYGQLAMLLGNPKQARRVGQAMFNTPFYVDIPAHRVINSKGEMAPADVFGGEGEQRRRLKAEGVVFKKNECVDLKKSIYIPD